ncbi:MAG: ATP-binding cassette domain-containing protein [Theionarchaea archaeon]|nr:ATP-binding cassette domain-containing protein [Theionarchaea archaeon]MBU7036386.1 ATP-binding cassette domain-containing protein [Theionarchaea archaeon]
MEYVIETKDLAREFDSAEGVLLKKKRKIIAVDHVTFGVRKGELFGLLGPNGAGKTTTIKMLTTLLVPTEGDAYVHGWHVVKEAQKIRNHINVIFGGERGLYLRLSGKDNLRYFSDLYGVPATTQKERIPELLQLVGLAEHGERKVETYSRGMKQRLHIARGLINDPSIIFMDEPTIGLDPEGARSLRAIIQGLTSKDKTIFLTTHYMFEADELCTRIALLKEGKILKIDTPKSFKNEVSHVTIIEAEGHHIPRELIDALEARQTVRMVTTSQQDMNQVLQIQTEPSTDVVMDILQSLHTARLSNIHIREPSLEDAYIKIMQG